MQPAVAAANALTARWCAALGDEDFVVSGAGAWPVLALLASGASGRARTELEAAIGRPAADAQAEAVELLGRLSGDGLSAALGLWIRDEVTLRDRWSAGLPEGTLGRLSGRGSVDQAALDAWCSQHTDGLIERLPITLTDREILVLASALMARTRWRDAFEPAWMTGRAGSWEGAELPLLERASEDLEEVCLLDGQITRAVVAGDTDLDVHLGIGAPDADATPAAVLAGLLDPRPVAGAAELLAGAAAPAVEVRTRELFGREHGDQVVLRLPAFALASSHDLLEHAALFGLAAATRSQTGHFDGISPDELAVTQAAQDVRATFSQEGFEAAAVTVVGMLAAGMPQPTGKTYSELAVTFDRPFGFAAVHRPSGLAIVAGWVSSPPPPRADSF